MLLAIRAPAADDVSITAYEAAKHVSETKTVCGVVASAKFAASSRGQPTFLNLEKPYPDHVFTIVIWREGRASFPFKPEQYYKGKTICVTGLIATYRGKPEIVVRSPAQIQLAEADDEGKKENGGE